MFDTLYQTQHATDRKKYVPNIHMIADLLFRYGCDDHRGRLCIPAKEVTTVAAEARASGLHKLARDLERAARVTFVMDGNALITVFHNTENEHVSSRYTHRRRRKRAAQHRRCRIW
jgi:hypothetical protein